jgi:hypothetical protein
MTMRKIKGELTNLQRKLFQHFNNADRGIFRNFFEGETSKNLNHNSELLNYFIKSLAEDKIFFECVTQVGGEGEGEGRGYFRVYKFTYTETGEEQHIKFDGWYESYNGSEYEECFFVTPKQKTITVYE